MSIIEQAARRLETLQRAGIAVPWEAARTSAVAAHPDPSHPPMDVATTAPWNQQRVTLDVERLARAGLLMPSVARSALADAFRRPKRTLLEQAWRGPQASDGRGRLILVSSAVPGEGKTYCAINLALSIALEVNTEVLLVDADAARPAVCDRLGISAERGLIDLLTTPGLDPSQVVLGTNIAQFSVLPCGSAHARSHELFASQALRELLQRLVARQRNQVVVLDAPALLVATEAAALADAVGQVVLVVEAERTPRRWVEQAFAMVAACPTVMGLLNKSTLPSATDAFDDYYADVTAGLGGRSAAPWEPPAQTTPLTVP